MRLSERVVPPAVISAETCAASSNAKLHDKLVGSANGDRHENPSLNPAFLSRDHERHVLFVCLLLSLLN